VAVTTSRSENRGRRAWVLLGLGACVAFSLVACNDEKSGPADASVASVDLPPVPRPADLAATLVVGKPGETWAKLRATGGGPARLLPQSFGLLVSTMLGLPAVAADSIDDDVPLTGAVTSDEKGQAQVAMAVHVRSGRELLARLSTGGDAPYSAKEDAASGITLLEPRANKAPTGVALGITGNYLVVAAVAADLTKVGPYVARTLSKEPPPKKPIAVSLEKRALSGPLAKLVRDAWQEKKRDLEQLDDANRQKHGGRTPDFGDPRAALAGLSSAVEGFIKVLETASAGRLTAEPIGSRLDVLAELDAEAQGAAADTFGAFVVGDAAPLGALPALAHIGILTRTNVAAREASAVSLQEGLGGLLADRLTGADREKIKGVLTKLAQGRGDWETYAVYVDAGKGGLAYRAAVSDPKAFDAGAKDLFKLLSIKALAEPVRQFAGDISVKQSTAQVPGVPGTTERTLIGLKPSPMRAAKDKTGKVSLQPDNLEVLWAHKDGRVLGAGSLDAVPVLGALVAAEAEPKLTHQADPKTSAALGRVKEASFVVLVQPQRLGGGGASTPSSPVVVSIGRRGKTGYLRADLDQAAFETLLRSVALGK
jgi:hypothetical protein